MGGPGVIATATNPVIPGLKLPVSPPPPTSGSIKNPEDGFQRASVGEHVEMGDRGPGGGGKLHAPSQHGQLVSFTMSFTDERDCTGLPEFCELPSELKETTGGGGCQNPRVTAWGCGCCLKWGEVFVLGD